MDKKGNKVFDKHRYNIQIDNPNGVSQKDGMMSKFATKRLKPIELRKINMNKKQKMIRAT